MEDTNWFQDLTVCEAREERRKLRDCVQYAIGAGCGLALLVAALDAVAGPMVRATVGNITITIYDEPCSLTNVVSNLPHRATWVEDGKTYEGCAGPNAELGIAIFYFSGDRSVAAVPLQMFTRVQGV